MGKKGKGNERKKNESSGPRAVGRLRDRRRHSRSLSRSSSRSSSRERRSSRRHHSQGKAPLILKYVEVFTFNLNRTTPAHAAALPIPHPSGTHVGPGDFLRIFCQVVSCETVFLVPCCCGHRDIKNACFATLALRAPPAPTAPPGAPQVGLPPRPPRLGSSDTRCPGQKQL